MKITKLSLTNFRSFKQTQTIDFAPVTLLFGPNSVGKSTVLMALFYLQKVIKKGSVIRNARGHVQQVMSVVLRT